VAYNVPFVALLLLVLYYLPVHIFCINFSGSALVPRINCLHFDVAVSAKALPTWAELMPLTNPEITAILDAGFYTRTTSLCITIVCCTIKLI